MSEAFQADPEVPLLASLACEAPAPAWRFESRRAGIAVVFPGEPTVTVEQQLTRGAARRKFHR
ncbi:hypothetical protein [Nannocystis punicea]|uniref:Uncharacterized protein n=1 Tax=Nannocystis punicea TaxID=2995304 RepID=A0ABY7HID6_9BACT|nr:hypothetical protein [Nannocystis poenicansa]WAS98837.1 hypothetical protein O0S08_22125 [Nannocystis poenicansa]